MVNEERREITVATKTRVLSDAIVSPVLTGTPECEVGGEGGPKSCRNNSEIRVKEDLSEELVSSGKLKDSADLMAKAAQFARALFSTTNFSPRTLNLKFHTQVSNHTIQNLSQASRAQLHTRKTNLPGVP